MHEHHIQKTKVRSQKPLCHKLLLHMLYASGDYNFILIYMCSPQESCVENEEFLKQMVLSFMVYTWVSF